MKCKLDRDTLIAPLQLVTNVIERRQTLPILSNVYLELKQGVMTLIGTDLEVEVSQEVSVAKEEANGACTVTARKLLDICRALPEGSIISLSGQGERLKLQSGRSRYTLQTLSAKEYPRIEPTNWATRIKLPAATLRRLFEKTAFSMAQQDVRYFLNGVLLEFSDQQVVAVATDGHRLARTECAVEQEAGATQQAIVPRKAVLEMSRFLAGSEEEITLEINPNHLRITRAGAVLTTKLIDGKFPDYRAVINQKLTREALAERQPLYEVLARTAVLTNDKYRGVRVSIEPGELKVSAHNPDQEEASDEITIVYDGDGLEIGFNVTYLMDALRALHTDQVQLAFEDGNSGCLVRSPGNTTTEYLIMPMRL